VTLRCERGIPSLRSARIFPPLRRAIAASNQADFRVVHFSVQVDHIHLLVEADASRALTPRLQGLAIRCARAVNRCLRRHGPVWADRFHAHPLATPREVRNALAYVLLNFQKHLRTRELVDPCSSGPWFDGWATSQPTVAEPRPLVDPRVPGQRLESRALK
jgi:putative transposase